MKVIANGTKTVQCMDGEGAVGVTLEKLVDETDGAPNFIMRRFTVDPGGHSPWHNHDYEHVVYVLEGSGHLRGEDQNRPFTAGDAVFVAPNIQHQFVNDTEHTLKFTCTIPR